MIENLFKALRAAHAISLPQIALRLSLSFAFAVVVSFVYRIVTTRRDSRDNFLPSLMIMGVTVAAAIMLIGDNIATSFGLVGAVSIIRFRAAVKSPLDMAFIFLIIVLGMACGLGFFNIAAAFFLFVTAATLAIWKLGAINNVPSFRARFAFGPGDATREAIEAELARGGYGYRFLSLRAAKSKTTLEYTVRLPLGGVGAFMQAFAPLLAAKALSIRLRPG